MVEYNFWKGFWKTIKNSAILLVPFAVAVLVGMPEKYAWITGPLMYFLNNLYKYTKNKEG